MPEPEKDVQAYLARIRKTIADSKRVVSQAALRIAETDRMLERQGLTREQVMAMRFTEAQKEAVNAELKRRGLDPLEMWEKGGEDWAAEKPEVEADDVGDRFSNVGESVRPDPELENRQRKFGMMMKPFQL